ncbi:MAG: hypothetical protein DDT19_01840 [Syntrophomonadaceae bacterium]|nr:hypothetical protein [Bacillota bacterium]
MKSNPVVFPFKPFKNLKNRKIKNNVILNVRLSIKELAVLLRSNDLERVVPTGTTVNEKIFSIFLHPEVYFGPKRFISNKRNDWLEKLNYFTKRRKPILFIILSFPGKAPVPFKTNRTMPDFGEVLALKRLRDIVLKVREVYAPGAIIYVITEGALGAYIGLSSRETQAYERELQRLTCLLGWNKYMKFIPIGKLKTLAGFKHLFVSERKRLKKKFREHDRDTVRKYALAYPSIFHLLNVRNIKQEVLFELYSTRGKQSVFAKKSVNALREKTREAIWNYLAFLVVRDRLRFVEREVPNHIPLTVSPKPSRLGINLIRKGCDLLPHHGIVVGKTVEYLIDVRRSNRNLIAVYLDEDREKLPFFYLPLEI